VGLSRGLSTGVTGFDRLVNDGLLRDRLYIRSGPLGGRKTTFYSQFITAGARNDEDYLYVMIHETESELAADTEEYQFGSDPRGPDALDRIDLDSTEATELPEFLDRE